MWKSLLVISATVLALNSCAAIPQALVGEFPPFTPETARGGAAGTRVRWGGEIIRTAPGAEETCFFMLSHPLDAQARPEVDHTSTGRFIACTSGFYEPEEYLPGRELTVTGKLQETVTSKVGDYDYSYPRVQADIVYLWPKRPQYVYVSDPWGPWGVWGSWYGPYWYGLYGPYGAFPR